MALQKNQVLINMCKQPTNLPQSLYTQQELAQYLAKKLKIISQKLEWIERPIDYQDLLVRRKTYELMLKELCPNYHYDWVNNVLYTINVPDGKPYIDDHI